MKKLILFFIIIVTILSVCAYATTVSGNQNGVEWSYSDGILTLTAEGNVYLSPYNIENFPKLSDIHTLVLSEGVTNVPVIAGTEQTLKTIHLPTTVTSAYYTFNKLYALEKITVTDGGSFSVIDGVLFNGDTLVCYPASKPEASYTVPSNVKVIDSAAFANAKNLTEVKIPNGVATINASAFYNCTKLNSVSLPATVTKIPNACFSGCTALVSIKLPDSVNSIGDSAFYNS